MRTPNPHTDALTHTNVVHVDCDILYEHVEIVGFWLLLEIRKEKRPLDFSYCTILHLSALDSSYQSVFVFRNSNQYFLP